MQIDTIPEVGSACASVNTSVSFSVFVYCAPSPRFGLLAAYAFIQPPLPWFSVPKQCSRSPVNSLPFPPLTLPSAYPSSFLNWALDPVYSVWNILPFFHISASWRFSHPQGPSQIYSPPPQFPPYLRDCSVLKPPRHRIFGSIPKIVFLYGLFWVPILNWECRIS